MIYALSFFVIVSPLLGVYVLTSSLSTVAKIWILGMFVAGLIIVPIAVFLVYGGSSLVGMSAPPSGVRPSVDGARLLEKSSATPLIGPLACTRVSRVLAGQLRTQPV